MKVDDIAATAAGHHVRIIGIDPDPTCEVLCVLVSNPDIAVSVARQDLTVLADQDSCQVCGWADYSPICPSCAAPEASCEITVGCNVYPTYKLTDPWPGTPDTQADDVVLSCRQCLPTARTAYRTATPA